MRSFFDVLSVLSTTMHTHTHTWMYVKYVWCSHMTKEKKCINLDGCIHIYVPEYTWNMSSSSSSLIACKNVVRIFICIGCHVCQSYWPTETERNESTLIFLPLCAGDAALCCVCPQFQHMTAFNRENKKKTTERKRAREQIREVKWDAECGLMV